MKENIIIRLEKENEYREVENLVRESFWNVYRPGCLEHYVLKGILIFMEKVDFDRQVNLVFVTMVWKKGRMLPFSYVKNCFLGIWMA